MRAITKEVIEKDLQKLKRTDLEAWFRSINEEYYEELEKRYGIRFED